MNDIIKNLLNGIKRWVQETFASKDDMPTKVSDLTNDSLVGDVKVDGTSIVTDGVAEISLAEQSVPGVICAMGYDDKNVGIYYNKPYWLSLHNTSNTEISNREGIRSPIYATNFDYAVKTAMCDGKGAAWTDDEKAAARERIGAEDASKKPLLKIAEFNATTNSNKIDLVDNVSKYRMIYARITRTADSTVGQNYALYLNIKGTTDRTTNRSGYSSPNVRILEIILHVYNGYTEAHINCSNQNNTLMTSFRTFIYIGGVGSAYLEAGLPVFDGTEKVIVYGALK